MKKIRIMMKYMYRKKQFYMGLIMWVALMIMHLKGIYLIAPEGRFPMDFMVLAVSSIIGLFVQQYQKKKIKAGTWYPMIVGIVMSTNYVLFRLGISIFNYLLLFITLGMLLCFDRLRKKNQTGLFQAALVLLMLASFLSLDYAQYQERLIKDHQLDRFIRDEYGFSHPVTAKELEEIEGFYLSYRHRVSRLDGLEYFTELTDIGFYDAASIQSLSPLADLPKLERLVLTGGNLDELNQLSEMKTVKKLEITYPDRGRLESLAAFSKIENLHLHGIPSPKHIGHLKELDIAPSLEELGLASMGNISVEELVQFESLKVLRFFRVHLKDVEYLQELKELEKIYVESVGFGTEEDEKLLYKLIKELDIELIDRDLGHELDPFHFSPHL